MISRRTAIKWLHWLSLFLILWFFLVEPEDVRDLGAAALATHAGMGVILALLTTAWFTMYLRKGLASRPGPKLPDWAKRAHPWLHRLLYWGTPVMVLSGALTGFAAPYVIRAFDLVPINPGIGSKTIQGLLKEVHEIAFNTLIVAIMAHVAFTLWRHFRLKDNVLRIMVPKLLHKYL